ncbi:hypothetical protein Tco_0707389 [Tanacetum coccineum]|uniref:Uncharacterized protein n=1 Tax=Tanacetum coccineum TaxID=301880 RepID=A0ABQ4YA52_9ASTR
MASRTFSLGVRSSIVMSLIAMSVVAVPGTGIVPKWNGPFFTESRSFLPCSLPWSYIPWESRFRRFLDNELEDGEWMWNSKLNVPYERPMIPNPDDTDKYVTVYPKKKKAAKNHDPLALLIQSNASSSHSHANSSYSPQPYYVTHPSLVVDYEDEYQGKLQGDSQEDKLITAMMLLARAITQKFPTPTNNRLGTSSNTRNQAVIQDGRVDVQTKNASYGGNWYKNA